MKGPSEDQVQAMYACYQQGASLVAVGKRFHYSGAAILYHFRKYGLTTRSYGETRRLQSDTETRAMYADYETGLSLVQVGRKWGYSGVAVLLRFKSRNLARRRPGKQDLRQ